MITPTINYLAVFIAAVATMVLGSIWYSPMLFGKIFMKECKMSEKDKKNGMKGMTSNYIIMFGTALVTAYILAHFVDYVEATSLSAALMLAFWIWLGFYATSELGSVLWEQKSMKYYAMNVGYHLVNLGIIATILTLWS